MKLPWAPSATGNAALISRTAPKNGPVSDSGRSAKVR